LETQAAQIRVGNRFLIALKSLMAKNMPFSFLKDKPQGVLSKVWKRCSRFFQRLDLRYPERSKAANLCAFAWNNFSKPWKRKRPGTGPGRLGADCAR
jgi:hypothetical protein